MTVALRLLLGLPPSLRCQVVSRGQSSLQWRLASLQHSPELTHTRAFRTTPASLAKPPRPRVLKKTQPPSSKAPPPAKPRAASQAPIPATPSLAPKPKATIESINRDLKEVLLYVSPNHGSFYFGSWFIGISFLIGAYSYAQITLKDQPDRPRNPWYMKASGGSVALFLAVISTTAFVAPTKLIKSISIITSPGVQGALPTRKLRFEIKRSLPFAKPDILEADPRKCAIDRRLNVAFDGIDFSNVPSADAKEWTQLYFAGQWLPEGNAGFFRRLNRGLLNLWPTMVREVQRILLRNKMTYVRVEGNGNFKLDLQGFFVLDNGRPLLQVMKVDDTRPSIAGLISRYLR